MTPALGIATLSLGCFEHHDLPSKLSAAKAAGFENVELFDNDWNDWRDSFARSKGLADCQDGDRTSLLAAAALAKIANDLGLSFSCWQPLRNFEGFISEDDREKSYQHAQGVLNLLPTLGIDLILCCTTSTGAPATTGDLATCARDLAWLADRAAELSPPVRVMHEGLSFAAHRRRWQDAWEVVVAADRPNLGICLDSFNTLALEWADPYAESGTLSPDVDALLEANMAELVATVPGDKIYLYQVADGRRMTPPMTPPEDPTVPRIRPWSRGNRLFPLEYERGAYLPVDKFSDAVVRTGYKGPWSLEVFNDSLNVPGADVPRHHAERGYVGLAAAAAQSYARCARLERTESDYSRASSVSDGSIDHKF